MKSFFDLVAGLVGGLIGLTVGLVLRLAEGFVRFVCMLPHLGRTISCPMGCPPQRADGWQLCAKCGARFKGWVWDPCYVCGVKPGFCTCVSCGHAIRSQVL